MKITKAKIKRELIKKYGWQTGNTETPFLDNLLKDVLSIIDAELKAHKGISIK